VRKPSAIIVDDEPHALNFMKAELAARWPELAIVGGALDGPAAVDLIESHRPDIAFLDIQIPGLTGLEVARRISGRCHIVFVTAHDEYAVQAFERAAVDYLLKPVDGTRLEVTVARLKSRLAAPPPDVAALFRALEERSKSRQYLQWLTVQRGERLLLVATEEVVLFEASHKYTLAVTRDDEWVIRTPLQELEEQLDPARFWRVHRNAIVRVGAIAYLNRVDPRHVFVHFQHLEREVRVSRAFFHRFKLQ
jgi:DNA-binding LytR/AlgR family response regulator